MRIPIDRSCTTPIYRQIENFIRQGILSGNLAPETRLPAIRELAHDLGINRITVENAYAGLEAEGLIFSRVGSGAYVLPPFELPPAGKEERTIPIPAWQQDLQKTSTQDNVVPEAFHALAQHPSPVDLMSGIGDARLFPVEELRKILQTIMRREGIAALGYGERNGYPPLRSTIAHILASQGVPVLAENILITGGSQQALALVAAVLLKPGDAVLVESPTYPGALDLFRMLALKVLGIVLDEQGMQVDKLERILQRHHPKLIYTMPNFQNPTGVCLSSPRRRHLILLADRYNIPLLEDDYVGDLRFEGRAQPALKALDPGARVIYVSTFSKMLMPGLRVGFLAAEGPVYEALVNCKYVADMATSNLIQRAVEAYVTVGRYQAHLRRSRRLYKKRRDAMVDAIRHYFPPDAWVEPPQGGLFLWLRLPYDLSAEKLLPLACEEGVAFAPGSLFFPRPADGECFVRLNFGAQPLELIEQGIERMGKAIRRLMVGG